VAATVTPPKRATYRHGDLRRALIDAGLELARADGPDAVVLREATRRTGVVPNAAYRHFADRNSLLQAVCWEAQRLAAETIEAKLAEVEPDEDAAAWARARVRAVGGGYLCFARHEPGLFLTAFSVPTDMSGITGIDEEGKRRPGPFGLLAQALDDMVLAGALPVERRPGAELLCWSAVHGLATLVLEGPLRAMSDEELASVGERVLDMVDRGV
jgi:AcrR family transcriptional regulator